jgi:penicillin-binding protein 1A
VTTLASATTTSDNSVFAEVGIKVGTKKIARLAKRMGIRTPVSRNWAMILGGLKQGVTPLDMAHAYQSFARKGKFVYGTLSPGELRKGKPVPGPVGIHAISRLDDDKKLQPIRLPDGSKAKNRVKTKRVLDESVANTVGTILQGVVKSGTAQRAQLGELPVAGKTGTTENYGDAWFVGWTPQYTVAVWVGYPKRFQPMKTEFQGKPVAGGTYPAGIWKTFMEAVLKIDPPPELEDDDETEGVPGATTPVPGAAATPAPAAPTPATPEETAPETGGETAPAQPEEPAPEQPSDIPPAEQPPTAPEGGGGETTPPSGGAAPPAPGPG